MSLKVLVTGATGMVGKGVLLECLDHPEISKVFTIGRSSTNIDHPKLEEILHANFADFSAIANRLTAIDACYLCMGVSVAGISEEKYTTYTYTYTISLAELLLSQNVGMTCIYVSGEGTDSTEKGRSMWARVKGKTENDLLNLGFKQAFMFRPGVIIPLRGIKSKTRAYQFVYDYFMWFIRLIKWMAPNQVVNTTQIGQAMILATIEGYPKNIVRAKDILTILSNS